MEEKNLPQSIFALSLVIVAVVAVLGLVAITNRQIESPIAIASLVVAIAIASLVVAVAAVPQRGKGAARLVFTKDSNEKSDIDMGGTDDDLGIGTIFISYSHKNLEWLNRLKTHLMPLRHMGISAWDDTQIHPGAEWKKEINFAISSARVAILLVNADYLALEYMRGQVSPFLNGAKNRGVKIFWILLGPCLYDITEIAKYQAAHDPQYPLASLSAVEADAALVSICKKIHAAMNGNRD